MEKVMTLSVTATTSGTASRSPLISKKHVIIEAKETNTKRVHVAVSYEYTGAGRRSTDFDTLDPSEVKFYSAPKDKLIHYLWYYCDGATQYINIRASDGSLNRLKDIDIEKEYPYEHLQSLELSAGAEDTTKNGFATPSETEDVLVLGFKFHASVWTAGDKVTIYHENVGFDVQHKPVVNYLLAGKELEHEVTFKRPMVIPKTDIILFEWNGTASEKKIALIIVEKRKSAITT